MVITIEPGLYLKNNIGVRIEDTIVVKKDGVEILTESPKELIIL
jgi:Xaa-Pro aminopeptidase